MDNETVFEEKVKKNVNSRDCINCFNCVEKCPEDDCLKVKFAGKEIFRSKYKPKTPSKDAKDVHHHKQGK